MGSRLEKKSNEVRKRIENHEFDNEEGEEYEASKFGGFNDYFRRKKIKLQNLDAEIRAESAGNLPLFKGIVAHVNGYTQPSLNDLHKLIVSHSGGFAQYLDGKTMVTHIIASNLTLKKAVEFRRYRIVKPAWIVDSVHAGKLQPWENYRLVDEGVGQKVLAFNNGNLASQVNSKKTGYKEQTETSWYTAQLAKTNAKKEAQGDTALQLQISELPDQLAQTSVEKEIHQDGARQSPDPRAMAETLSTTSVQQSALVAANSESDTSPIKQPVVDSPSRSLTAEEHNTILLRDPHIRKASVLNPDFLNQYYSSSRLHHLSIWKADLKSQLQALTAAKSPSQQALAKRPLGARRYILHVDFDSFFVAVSLLASPALVAKPCVVAHGSGSGSEIASCNYPAREFGVRNGMWMKRAQELCGDLTVLPYDFPAYETASRKFYDAILQTGGVVQSVSIDEALVDVTNLCITAGSSGDGVSRHEGSVDREQAKAWSVAEALRARVKEDTGCAVSVGIGGNILLAKVALRKAKPAGQYHVIPGEALEFIGTLPVQDLPGVAYSIGGKLEEIGVKLVKDVREISKERLINVLGPKTGEKIYNYGRGIDKSEVGDQVVRKSVSAEVNWGVRFETQEQVDEFMGSMCGELERRLLKEQVKGKQLTVKVMRRAQDAPLDPPKHLGHGKCDTFNRSVVLGVATCEKDVLTKEVLSVMKGFSFSPGELRGLGVQMTKLEITKGGLAEGSQPRLRFASANGAGPTAAPHQSGVDGQQEVGGSRKRTVRFKIPVRSRHGQTEDAIAEDPVTPQKRKTGDGAAASISSVFRTMDSPSKKPLNVSGTQFVLPTQMDARVLAELPDDIRTKLERAQFARSQGKEEATAKSMLMAPLPNQSQLDPDSLLALPEDMQEEVLARYEQSPSKRRAIREQAVLPQSPRKTRTVVVPARGRSRGRGGGNLLSPFKSVASRGDTPTLTQANFVHTRQVGSEEAEADVAIVEEISDDFLAALPSDIRAEVLEQQRREQLRRTGGLEVQHRRGAKPPPRLEETDADESADDDEDDQEPQRLLKLPPRPQRPTFTVRKLWRPDDLRKAVTQWHQEFRDEGPYAEDAEALGRYLTSVVADEGDMDKAAGVIRWLQWTLANDSGAGGNEEAQARWREALAKAQQSVAQAGRQRGLMIDATSSRGDGYCQTDAGQFTPSALLSLPAADCELISRPGARPCPPALSTHTHQRPHSGPRATTAHRSRALQLAERSHASICSTLTLQTSNHPLRAGPRRLRVCSLRPIRGPSAPSAQPLTPLASFSGLPAAAWCHCVRSPVSCVCGTAAGPARYFLCNKITLRAQHLDPLLRCFLSHSPAHPPMEAAQDLITRLGTVSTPFTSFVGIDPLADPTLPQNRPSAFLPLTAAITVPAAFPPTPPPSPPKQSIAPRKPRRLPSAGWTSFKHWNYGGYKERLELFLSTVNREAFVEHVFRLTGKQCSVSEPFSAGQYWCCFELVADDGDLYIARARLPPHPSQKVPADVARHRAENEIATMRLVRQRTSIPIPEVYAYEREGTMLAEAAGASYMLLQGFYGNSILEKTYDLSSIPDQTLRRLLHQWAGYVVELSSITFPAIGGVVESPTAPGGFDIGPLATDDAGICGPFTSAKDYFTALADGALKHSLALPWKANDEHHHLRQVGPAIVADVVANAPQLFGGAGSVNSTGPFSLFHMDLGIHNILVDDSFNILAVIDWELASTAPATADFLPMPFQPALDPEADRAILRNPSNRRFHHLKREYAMRKFFTDGLKEAEARLREDGRLSSSLPEAELRSKVFHSPASTAYYLMERQGKSEQERRGAVSREEGEGSANDGVRARATADGGEALSKRETPLVAREFMTGGGRGACNDAMSSAAKSHSGLGRIQSKVQEIKCKLGWWIFLLLHFWVSGVMIPNIRGHWSSNRRHQTNRKRNPPPCPAVTPSWPEFPRIGVRVIMGIPHRAILALSVVIPLALSRLAPEYLIKHSVWTSGWTLYAVQLLAYFSWSVVLYPLFFSPLRHLPEPKGSSIFMGQYRRILKDPSGHPQREWINEIPNDGIIRYRGVFNSERLLLTSPRALGEAMVTKNYDFVKPSAIQASIGRILGIGVLFAEGDEHRRQRKNLTPAFTYRHIKNLYPVFWGKTVEMIQAMDEDLAKPDPTTPSEGEEKPRPSNVVQVDEWASRSTLDIIGVAGFDKTFGAIQDHDAPLYQTYAKLFRPNRVARIMGLLSIIVPFWVLRLLPVQRNNDIQEASEYIKDVCRSMIKIKKTKLADAEAKAGGKEIDDTALGVDILSVALRSGGFTDEDLVNQMMTFLAAGHETTASAMTWAMLHLCQHPEVQTRLRKELRDAGLPSARDSSTTVTAEQLDKIPYLHAVCNETLRFTPPVPLTLRVAARDTSIQGQFVPKGTTLIYSPSAMSFNKAIWGADADKFQPERWMGKNTNSGGAESNYAFLTFLHGPRSCIGQGFSKAEFACLLAGWVMSYESVLADPEREIEVGGGITQRPKNGLAVKLTPVY
ncbi:hypothetical protein FH972_023410 [Carpinus fangiana]|uniref:DNA repair protein REV1 n=1 Tax=Carpinus fangiana TaxID=176857 RepID=A0A5N6KVQ8_9ROSI|nr:hypothetical protein FH972_023410 [Carpinus fangiana]